MEIFIQNEAPPELVRIIDQVYDGIESINNVVIGTAIPELAEKKALGAFEPVTGTVWIDLMNCLTDKRWMVKGSLFIPNVWFNLMFVVHHELVHACQFLDDPSLLKADVVPPELEAQADQMAQDAVWSWFDQGGKIPPLAELGWVGQQIAKTMNGLFSTIPESVIEEMDMLKEGAVANVEAVVSAHDHFNDIDALNLEIDNGSIGIIANGRKYLTADEFLAV